MQVFLVQISGTDIRGNFGDEELICGFVKNEYVIASSAESAQEKAIARVELKLRAKSNLHSDDVRRVELRVDRVEPGFSWFSVFRDEGFVFHPVE
jgi:hypothetical protein